MRFLFDGLILLLMDGWKAILQSTALTDGIMLEIKFIENKSFQKNH